MRIYVGAAERTGKLTVYEPQTTASDRILRYCPDGFTNDGNSKPLFLVYGDKAFTEESAKLALEKSGFADLAADANSNILFVSPVGETWGEADVDLYRQVYRKIEHCYGGENGVKEVVNFYTREPEGLRVVGSEFMVFIYAEGKGADFVAEMMVGDGLFFPNAEGEGAVHPAGVMLCNTTTMPKLGRLGMPAYIVNGTAAQAEAFKAGLEVEREETRIVIEAASEMKDGFDPALVMDAWLNMFSKLRRKDDGSGADLFCIPDYEGFTIEDETVELSTGPMRLLTFIPGELDMTRTAAYPLVMCFHGGGDDALFCSWCSEWPYVGKKEGFAVSFVDQHGHHSCDDVVEALQYLLKKHPALDPGKVYANGFSMGGGKTWQCGMFHSKYFAGVAPMDAAGRPASGNATELNGRPIDFDHVMPTIYIVGEKDPLSVGPNQKMKDGTIFTGANNMMNILFRKNGTGTYTYDPEGDYYWGLKCEETVTTEGRMTAHTHTVANPDGISYCAFCNIAGQSHVQMGIGSREAWKFLRKFRRMPDGRIVVE